MNSLDERQMEQHVTIVAWLRIAGSALVLLVALCACVFLPGIGLISGDPEAVTVLGFIATIAVVFLGALSLPGILAGYGLLKRKNWGRILAIVVGVLDLANFPIGTAIGIYSLWVLLQDSASAYFALGSSTPGE
jgi:hypothetical protein